MSRRAETVRDGEGVIPAWRRFGARRRRRRVVVALAVALAATAAGVGWALLTSGTFALEKIRVELTVNSTSSLTVHEVSAAADAPLRRPLIDLPLGAIQRRVAALPDVAEVTVHRSWPHTLVLHVTARRAAVRLLAADGAFVSDRLGIVFAEDLPAAAIRGLATVRLPGRSLLVGPRPVPEARAAVRLLDSVPRSVVRSARSLEVRRSLLQFVTQRTTVLWGDSAAGPTKAAELATVLSRPSRHRPGWVDLSTPGLVVTRPVAPGGKPAGHARATGAAARSAQHAAQKPHRP